MRLVPVVLLALLLFVQAELWFGRGGVPHVMSLRAELAAQQASNDKARAQNERLAAEVTDLKEGLEMVEEKARLELGMVRPDELLVVIARNPTMPAGTALAPASGPNAAAASSNEPTH